MQILSLNLLVDLLVFNAAHIQLFRGRQFYKWWNRSIYPDKSPNCHTLLKDSMFLVNIPIECIGGIQFL